VRELEGKDGIIACRFRAKLFYANAGERKFKIFFNEAGDAARYITPSYFRDEALAIPGIFPSHGHHKYLNNGIDYKTFLELEAMNFDWQWQLMKKTWENHEVDITVVYSVYLDTINHQYRSIFEGLVPASDREFREAHQLYEDAYMLADEFLGKIIDFVDEETTIVAVSDHGSMGYNTIISPFTVLERAGLLAYNDTGVPGKKTVDWSRTLAYPVGTCHVYVNLKGRDPHGIVDERDYDMVVNRIIKVLQDGFRDDKKGICALAFALRREEAGLAGQGGEYCGDVVYGLAGTTIGGYYGGVHACQIPTARTSTGDMRALFVIAGPGFKKGEVISRCVHLYDAAPTLCYALGYPQPAHAEGRIVFDALNF
ncbi:MAG: hypothetical protein GX754_12040, partial [Clostridiaceae bacterium]|nr:hypothetical protein [Clostridiaceae bacterium]